MGGQQHVPAREPGLREPAQREPAPREPVQREPELREPALRKRGRPTADERLRRESEILTAALGVFLRSGYGGSTVDELAAAAQVTKRTLYAYYGDKAGLFTAMVRDLAAAVSLDAARDRDTLETLAARIVSRVHSDELVGLHQLVIAESTRFPELALILHTNGDARHISRLAEHIRAERGAAREPLAEPLFSLLLGEKHRRRLLGIDPAPTSVQAAAHADTALSLLGLGQRTVLRAGYSLDMTSPEHLDNRHRNTLRQIFEHPASHNVEWHAVVSLLEAVGSVTVRPDGKVAVKIGPDLEFLEPPAGKDVDVQMVVDLRRMLSDAGFAPS